MQHQSLHCSPSPAVTDDFLGCKSFATKKHHAIDYLSSGIKVVLEGLKEVAMICPLVFSGYAIETLFPQKPIPKMY